MTDINELTANAESTIGILENIAGYEPGDIDGDTVELRLEDGTGCDTGCNVSIVDLCQNAADVIRALTEALEAAESRIAEFKARVKAAEKRYENRTPTEWAYGQAYAAIENHRARADAAEARIAELEARTLTVKLPDEVNVLLNHLEDVIPHNVFERIDVATWNAVSRLAAVGIKLQIEGDSL